MKKKIIYPKVDGEKLDIINRRYFDSLRESFEWVITDSLIKDKNLKTSEKEVIKDLAKTCAWNCAFMVVTSRE